MGIPQKSQILKKRRFRFHIGGFLVMCLKVCLLFSGFAVLHAEDEDGFLGALRVAYPTAKTLDQPFPGQSVEDARAVQREFITSLCGIMGPVIGYKAALTNSAAQKRFGVDQPIRGPLLRDMILKSGARVPLNFAAVPLLEGDLVVRVAGEAINRAEGRKEALAALDMVYPFLELPDAVFRKGVEIDGLALIAINAGARFGVLGEGVPLGKMANPEKALAQIEVVVSDENGRELANGESRNLLGHPLDVVLWLRDSLHAEGKKLKRGDLLSLGSMTALVPLRSAGTYSAQFEGLHPERVMRVDVILEEPR